DERRAVALIVGGVVLPHLVAEDRGIPLQLADVGARVGVEQQLVRVEPVSLLGLVRSMDAEAVDGPRTDVAHIAVPDLVAVFRQLDARGRSLAAGIEQTALHLGGVRREQREVDPFAVPGRPLGVRQTFLYRGELKFGRVHIEQTIARKRRAAKCADRTTQGFNATFRPEAGWWRGCSCAARRPLAGAGSCAARRGRRGARAPGAQRAGCG